MLIGRIHQKASLLGGVRGEGVMEGLVGSAMVTGRAWRARPALGACLP